MVSVADRAAARRPVFSELLGPHHPGLENMPKLNGNPGRYAANGGIWIEAIRKGISS